MKRLLTLIILCSCSALTLWAEQLTSLAGKVVDAQTGETLPYVQIYFIHNGNKGVKPTTVGTTSDLYGQFALENSEGYTTVLFQMLGYKTEMYTLRTGQVRKSAVIRLSPDVYNLDDIVVTPKNRKQKYRRKGNPAVELIKEVIAHKDSATVRDTTFYTSDVYTKMSFALDNFHPNFKKGLWKQFAFAEKYIDTTGTYDALTVSIRENTANEYYQRKPHREKKIVNKRRLFGLEEELGNESFQETVNNIFTDFDINDDNMNLLYNRFVSPISSTLAVSYYQYYIMDTIMVDGIRCIDLAFVPVNSQSYSFTGHLYIVDDGSYKIKRYAINIPPHINLNFVSNFSIEHSYIRLDNGLWAPERTTTYAKFYLVNKKKRTILARETKLYTGWDFDTEIPAKTFSAMTPAEAKGQRTASAAWDTLRPEPLTYYEASVYDMVQECLATPKFNAIVMAVNAVTTEYLPTKRAAERRFSKFNFGPLYSTVSWNKLEGVRLRVGGLTTTRLDSSLFWRGYMAFGIDDLRPKFKSTLTYSFEKKKKHPYQPLKNLIGLTVSYDVEEPGQAVGVIERDNILQSIPLHKPTPKNYQYVFHTTVDYWKDWQNKLSLHTTFDFSHNAAAGALHYDRITAIQDNPELIMNDRLQTTNNQKGYFNYEGIFELRYSPGKFARIDRAGRESQYSLDKDAPVIKLQHNIGLLDDRWDGGKAFFYNRTELSAEKRFWLSSFGHIDASIRTGIIWNRVPFTKLYIPPSSSSIFYAMNSFNQMQPMEFLLDQYVSVFTTYYLKGWIMNRIPGLNRLKLRGLIGFSGLYGGLTDKNNPYIGNSEGLYKFPMDNAKYRDDETGNHVEHIRGYASSPIGKLPYMEINAGIENIFKVLRVDYIRRLTYNDYTLPNGAQRKKGIWGRNGVKISLRLTL